MLQNRVDPWGRLHAVSHRGTLMGNRGILHDADQQIRREWAHQHWVTCLLEFRGIQRAKPFSTSDNYSELFFLDEATAFAAGHRPCHHCQRERSAAFKTAWTRGNAPDAGFVSMQDIDRALHRERVDRSRGKVTFERALESLPPGTMFEHQQQAFVASPRGFLPWSFSGYGSTTAIPLQTPVKVLTPVSVVRAFATGFVPKLHASATAD